MNRVTFPVENVISVHSDEKIKMLLTIISARDQNLEFKSF